MPNEPDKKMDIFDTVRYIIGAIALLTGLYIFLVRGEEPSAFFWAMGSGLIGAQWVIEQFKKEK